MLSDCMRGSLCPPGVVGEDLHGGGVRLLSDVARTVGVGVQDAARKNDLLLVEGHEHQAHHGRGGGPRDVLGHGFDRDAPVRIPPGDEPRLRSRLLEQKAAAVDDGALFCSLFTRRL